MSENNAGAIDPATGHAGKSSHAPFEKWLTLSFLCHAYSLLSVPIFFSHSST